MNQGRAKIVCTIGPASSGRAVLFHLIKRGMDVARLNMLDSFAHLSYVFS